MLQTSTPEADNHGENTAFTQEITNEQPETAPNEREPTKQFPLRLPIKVINDLENEVKTRRLRGEIIETAMYCRFILENHRKVSNYDAEIEALRRENAALTQRILELQLHDENTALPSELPESANDNRRAFQALQAAVKKAAETIAEYESRPSEYYEAIVSEYFRQILPQITQ